MSYFDQASLVMIPSGYKTSKVYSVKPTDGSGDLAFSRSNDTATRVNSAGLIEKVRANLATYSEQLNNSSGWGFEQLAVTANAVANPLDGAVTADKIYATVTGSSVPILKQYTAATANQTITVSGYFKKAEYDYVVIHGFGLGGTVFNLAAGTKSGAGTITSVGNGWYRCAAVLAMSGDARTFITPSVDGNVGYTSTANSGVYAFGMQFELGDIATDYIATTSAAVSVGPVANVPRLDYLNSSCPRLLLEPQRTSLVTFSESFDNAAWGSANVAITANQAVSPDGYTNADLAVNIGSTSYLFQGLGSPFSGTYTISIFAKKNTASNFAFGLVAGGFTGGMGVKFNFDTQTFSTPTNYGNFTSISASYQSYGNGWYRLNLTGTTATSTTYFFVLGSLQESFAVNAYVYGAQVEAGAYATSYIPTLGAAVTRGADAASKTGISSLIGQTEGTLFVDFNWQQKDGVFFVNSISDGTTDNEIMMALGSTDNNRLRFSIVSGGSSSVSFDSNALASGRYKVAFAYANNNATAYINGVQQFTDSSVTIPATSAFKFLRANDTLGFVGSINQQLLFPTRLSNADLAALTA